MTTATWPFSMELSSLTMRMRQVQRINNDAASRMRPTARSGSVVWAKMWAPVGDEHMTSVQEAPNPQRQRMSAQRSSLS